MLSVTQISTFYRDIGGVEKTVKDLVLGLKQHHQVQVLCTGNGKGTNESLIDGVPVKCVGSELSLAGRPLAFSFPAELAKQNTDILHYHLPFPLAVASHLLVKPKALVVASWHHDLVRHNLFRTLWTPYQKRFFNSADAIIVAAPTIRDNHPLLSAYRDKCHIIPFGVDTARFEIDRTDEVRALRAKYKSPLVLYTGRLVYYKGCEVLIKAMKDVEGSLLIIGDGPLRPELQTLAQEMGIGDRIHFLGRLSDNDLAVCYQATDIFVLPSTLPTECFGLVQLEAMCCGKPVINTALPTGVPWVSKDGESGLTVPPGDVGALTQAINTLLLNESLRQKLGAQGKQRVFREFTMERYIASTAKLYTELAANRPPS